MKSKSIIINELLSDGFSVIENYYNSNFCKKAIEDINRLIKKMEVNYILFLRRELLVIRDCLKLKTSVKKQNFLRKINL